MSEKFKPQITENLKQKALQENVEVDSRISKAIEQEEQSIMDKIPKDNELKEKYTKLLEEYKANTADSKLDEWGGPHVALEQIAILTHGKLATLVEHTEALKDFKVLKGKNLSQEKELIDWFYVKGIENKDVIIQAVQEELGNETPTAGVVIDCENVLERINSGQVSNPSETQQAINTATPLANINVANSKYPNNPENPGKTANALQENILQILNKNPKELVQKDLSILSVFQTQIDTDVKKHAAEYQQFTEFMDKSAQIGAFQKKVFREIVHTDLNNPQAWEKFQNKHFKQEDINQVKELIKDVNIHDFFATIQNAPHKVIEMVRTIIGVPIESAGAEIFDRVMTALIIQGLKLGIDQLAPAAVKQFLGRLPVYVVPQAKEMVRFGYSASESEQLPQFLGLQGNMSPEAKALHLDTAISAHGNWSALQKEKDFVNMRLEALGYDSTQDHEGELKDINAEHHDEINTLVGRMKEINSELSGFTVLDQTIKDTYTKADIDAATKTYQEAINAKKQNIIPGPAYFMQFHPRYKMHSAAVDLQAINTQVEQYLSTNGSLPESSKKYLELFVKEGKDQKDSLNQLIQQFEQKQKANLDKSRLQGDTPEEKIEAAKTNHEEAQKKVQEYTTEYKEGMNLSTLDGKALVQYGQKILEQAKALPNQADREAMIKKFYSDTNFREKLLTTLRDADEINNPHTVSLLLPIVDIKLFDSEEAGDFFHELLYPKNDTNYSPERMEELLKVFEKHRVQTAQVYKENSQVALAQKNGVEAYQAHAKATEAIRNTVGDFAGVEQIMASPEHKEFLDGVQQSLGLIAALEANLGPVENLSRVLSSYPLYNEDIDGTPIKEFIKQLPALKETLKSVQKEYVEAVKNGKPTETIQAAYRRVSTQMDMMNGLLGKVLEGLKTPENRRKLAEAAEFMRTKVKEGATRRLRNIEHYERQSNSEFLKKYLTSKTLNIETAMKEATTDFERLKVQQRMGSIINTNLRTLSKSVELTGDAKKAFAYMEGDLGKLQTALQAKQVLIRDQRSQTETGFNAQSIARVDGEITLIMERFNSIGLTAMIDGSINELKTKNDLDTHRINGNNVVSNALDTYKNAKLSGNAKKLLDGTMDYSQLRRESDMKAVSIEIETNIDLQKRLHRLEGYVLKLNDELKKLGGAQAPIFTLEMLGVTEQTYYQKLINEAKGDGNAETVVIPVITKVVEMTQAVNDLLQGGFDKAFDANKTPAERLAAAKTAAKALRGNKALYYSHRASFSELQVLKPGEALNNGKLASEAFATAYNMMVMMLPTSTSRGMQAPLAEKLSDHFEKYGWGMYSPHEVTAAIANSQYFSSNKELTSQVNAVLGTSKKTMISQNFGQFESGRYTSVAGSKIESGILLHLPVRYAQKDGKFYRVRSVMAVKADCFNPNPSNLILKFEEIKGFGNSGLNLPTTPALDKFVKNIEHGTTLVETQWEIGIGINPLPLLTGKSDYSNAQSGDQQGVSKGAGNARDTAKNLGLGSK